jgi:hypothetical protein
MPSGQKVHWSDVMKELQNAQNYYKTRHGGGPIGKALSKFGRYTESLKGWLDLLPAGDYGSTICGTYAPIIFDAIDAIDAKRPRIVQADSSYCYRYGSRNIPD